MTVQEKLLEINSTLNQAFGQINLLILENPDFYIWPASPTKHHAYNGGLAVHVLEVVSFVDYFCSKNTDLKRDIAITGAMWHDTGKLKDYQFNKELNKWDYSPHRESIGHIATSYADFMRAATMIFPNTIRPHEIDEIGHLILSHHRNYGSNVQPQTKEAFLLHFVDSISAFVFGKP